MEMIFCSRKIIGAAVERTVGESDDHGQHAASNQEQERDDHHQDHYPSPPLLRM
jgi:hypothetical protein